MPTGQALVIRCGACVPLSVNHGPMRASTKPRLINAIVVRIHARKVRSLAKCSAARFSDGISRCRCRCAIAQGNAPGAFMSIFSVIRRGTRNRKVSPASAVESAVLSGNRSGELRFDALRTAHPTAMGCRNNFFECANRLQRFVVHRDGAVNEIVVLR